MRKFKTLGVLGALAVVVATMAVLLAGTASARGSGTVNCDTFPGAGTLADPYVMDKKLKGNLEITDGVCRVVGKVRGDIMVMDDSSDCTPLVAPNFTAADVVGGEIRGSIISEGGACVMIWLKAGAKVKGDVIHLADGNMGFLGADPGAKVDGTVVIGGGKLFASGGNSTENKVRGHIVCTGGAPSGGLGTGSATDWDGDGNDDGTIRGRYLGC